MAMCASHPFSPVGQLGCAQCHGEELAATDKRGRKSHATAPFRKRRRKVDDLPDDDTFDLDEVSRLGGTAFSHERPPVVARESSFRDLID